MLVTMNELKLSAHRPVWGVYLSCFFGHKRNAKKVIASIVVKEPHFISLFEYAWKITKNMSRYE